MFPRSACDSCADNLGGSEFLRKVQEAENSSDPDAILKITRSLPDLPDFWAHSSVNCQICNDPNYSDRSDAINRSDFETVRAYPKERLLTLAGPSGGKAVSIDFTDAVSGQDQDLKEKIGKTLQYLKARPCRYRVAVICELFKILFNQHANKIIAGMTAYGVSFPGLRNTAATNHTMITSDTQRLLNLLMRLPIVDMVKTLGRFIASDSNIAGNVAVYQSMQIKLDLKNDAFMAMKQGKEPAEIVFATNAQMNTPGSKILNMKGGMKRKSETNGGPNSKNLRTDVNRQPALLDLQRYKVTLICQD